MPVVLSVIAAIVLVAAGVRARGTPIRPVRFYVAIALLTAVLAGASAHQVGAGPAGSAVLIVAVVAGSVAVCAAAEASARRRRPVSRPGR